MEVKLKKERADLTRFDEELRDLDQVIKEKRQAVADAELKIKEADHQITTLQKERTAATNAVAALEKGNPWIEGEKGYVGPRLPYGIILVLRADEYFLYSSFGKSGSAYDFTKRDVGQETEKARELENQLKGMKKSINPKVMGMIETWVLRPVISFGRYMATYRAGRVTVIESKRRKRSFSKCSPPLIKTRRRSKTPSQSSNDTNVTRYTRPGKRSTVILVASLLSYCLGTMPSCSHQKGRTLARALRSRYNSEVCGSRA